MPPRPQLRRADHTFTLTPTQALCDAPATAAALGRADPERLFPEVSRLMKEVLTLP